MRCEDCSGGGRSRIRKSQSRGQARDRGLSMSCRDRWGERSPKIGLGGGGRRGSW